MLNDNGSRTEWIRTMIDPDRDQWIRMDWIGMDWIRWYDGGGLVSLDPVVV